MLLLLLLFHSRKSGGRAVRPPRGTCRATTDPREPGKRAYQPQQKGRSVAGGSKAPDNAAARAQRLRAQNLATRWFRQNGYYHTSVKSAIAP